MRARRRDGRRRPRRSRRTPGHCRSPTRPSTWPSPPSARCRSSPDPTPGARRGRPGAAPGRPVGLRRDPPRRAGRSPTTPAERGLTATRSYFDRRPYVETDESGGVALRRVPPHARRPRRRRRRRRARPRPASSSRSGRPGTTGRGAAGVPVRRCPVARAPRDLRDAPRAAAPTESDRPRVGAVRQCTAPSPSRRRSATGPPSRRTSPGCVSSLLELRADPAQQERQRDRDDARVLQREHGEVDARCP